MKPMPSQIQSAYIPFISPFIANDSTPNLVYLAQCDTTAGLLSANAEILNRLKGRPKGQNVLLQVDSLQTLKTLTRIPAIHKNRIRKARLSTFIYPNKKAIRLVNKGLHTQFFTSFKILYSTSANPTGEPFNQQWAEAKCDVIVFDRRSLRQGEASKIYKINRCAIQRRR
ncbi:Sua5/YciO/YrdC/YwlC family protein [uncultured Helicobacter sp.]|uniref:Sua5/YciO/YrdC/YwlC family protein n=2 Tax=uncultured Helicobacter sp. TaxID=175537 RepID=UPI00343870A6